MGTVVRLALPLLLLLAVGEEAPTPAERVAALRRTCADKRVKLANWAKGKKLCTEARAQYLIAVHLAADHSTARARLGHRRMKNGTWSRKREKTFRDEDGAREMFGEELAKLELALCREEASAFAELGETLVAEGLEGLGRPLLLRAFFLYPRSPRAAKGLGLVPIREGFVTAADAPVLRATPVAKRKEFRGTLSKTLGIETDVTAAGSALAEGEKGMPALGDLARLADQAQRLTSLRFGLPLQRMGRVKLIVVTGQERFDDFVDALKLNEQWASFAKRIGSLRLFRTRYLLASWTTPGSTARSCARVLLHMTAESVLYRHGGVEVPAWLTEAVGHDTCLTLLGRSGRQGYTFEDSAGISKMEALDEPEGWPSLLLKRAATGRICRLEHMVTAKHAGLGREDVITSLAYYRYLLLTKRAGLGKYLVAFKQKRDVAGIFVGAFVTTPEAVTNALRTILLGAPPIVPLGRPAGR